MSTGGPSDGVTVGKTEKIGKIGKGRAAGAGQNAGALIAVARDGSYNVKRWGRAAMGKAMCAGRWLVTANRVALAEATVSTGARGNVPTTLAPPSPVGWSDFVMASRGSSQNFRQPAVLESDGFFWCAWTTGTPWVAAENDDWVPSFGVFSKHALATPVPHAKSHTTRIIQVVCRMVRWDRCMFVRGWVGNGQRVGLGAFVALTQIKKNNRGTKASERSVRPVHRYGLLGTEQREATTARPVEAAACVGRVFGGGCDRKPAASP